MLASIIALLLSAFVTGALARFAVPGPDPMPAWLTVAIGLGGSLIGWGIVVAAIGPDAAWTGIAGFLAATALVVAYRLLVQKRPLWGPEAYRFPERGFGVRDYRERLERAGIDPNQIGSPFAPPQAGGDGTGLRLRARRRSPEASTPERGRPDRQPRPLPRPARGAPRLRRPRTRTSTGPHACVCSSGCGPSAALRERLEPARERAPRHEPPVVAAPGVGERRQRRLAGLVDVQAARLAEPVRARLPEAGRDRDDRRPRVAPDGLELAPLGDRRLVDVPGEDQVGAGRRRASRRHGRGSTRAACAPPATVRRAGDGGAPRRGTRRPRPRRAAPLRAAAARRSARRPGGGTAGPSSGRRRAARPRRTSARSSPTGARTRPTGSRSGPGTVYGRS